MSRIVVVLSAILLASTGCTDVIPVVTEPVAPRLVVDAWINNLDTTQTIRLTRSQPYFDATPAAGVSGAQITVVNENGLQMVFGDQGDGTYIWESDGQSIGDIGTSYILSIELDGRTYGATSQLRRVPPIDSIHTEFREAELGFPEGIYAELFARDFAGRGDTYWIKTWKNGEYLNKGFEINIAYDAGFDPGAQVDGVVFIPPIRELINRVPDPGSDAPDNFDVPPYAIGDSIYVEIHSITPEAFAFMEIARDQINNGANTIFAIPLANPQGNVFDVETGEQLLGFFCVSAVSRQGKVIEE
ncbi:MAG: DUF4249 domain-containing protein [Saprospiraceae bacterium]|nr:DUF4249 domain-containing protein [Saprospiraceae bacterium]